MRRRLHSMLFLLFLAWLLGAISRTAEATELNAVDMDEEDLKQLVVMVDAKLGGEPIYGAGIIFGAGTDSLYIATANHVVRAGEIEAEDIQLRFRWLPDQPVQASLLRQRDLMLDLAVLRVVGLKASGGRVDALPFERLRNPSALKRGEGLYLLGYPLRKAWRVNTTPEKFAETTGDVVEFESNFVARGHSGGALLDEQRNLVGMVKSDSPPYGEGVSITKIANRLREWGYPVRLGIPTIPVTFSSLSAGSAHICGLTSTGAAYCWGSIGSDDTRGDHFGDHGSTTFSALPVRVRGGLMFHSLSAGLYHTCGVTMEGHAYCWGSNGFDQLGSGDTDQISSEVPVAVAGGVAFRSVSAGDLRTCGVSNDGSVFCWGGMFDPRSDRPVLVAGTVTFASIGGGDLLFGITKSGETYWWKQKAKSDVPVRAPGNIRLESLSKTCGLTDSGDAYCWVQLKDAGVEALRVPTGFKFLALSDDGDHSACAVATPGDVYCWSLSGLQDAKSAEFVPKLVSRGIRFTSVTVGKGVFGKGYACGTTKEGGIYCWGELDNIFTNGEHEDYGPVPMPAFHDAQRSFLLTIRDRGAVNRCYIGAHK